MGKRGGTALAASTALLLAAACGGGDGGVSRDDLREALAEICAAFDAVDAIDEPEAIGDVEAYATAVLEIFTGVREELEDVEAPENAQDDLDAYRDAVDDAVDLLEDLQQAGEDEDADEVGELTERLPDIEERATEAADELGVDECKPEIDAPADTTPDTTPGTTTDSTSDTAGETTVPTTLPPDTTSSTPEPTTTVAATDAPTTSAPVTLPPPTLPPSTVVQTTAAPPPTTVAQIDFEILDLPATFNTFPPFTLGPPTADGEAVFLGLIVQTPSLNEALESMGVAIINDETGTGVAVIIVGFAEDGVEVLPEEWTTLICDPAVSEIHTTPAGFVGTLCDADPESGLIEILSIIDGGIGVTVATTSPFVSVDDLMDGFVLAQGN